MHLDRFAKYSWGILGYTLLVILWGAYVRITGSGAGCGSHWPLCGGDVVPRSPQMETMIEFTHRVTSGLAGILVLVLVVWAFRKYVSGHPVRTAAVLSLVFIVTESLLGAGLVKFELVADNDSIARALTIAAHLVNTFLLIAAMTLTAWWASAGTGVRIQGRGKTVWLLGIGLVGTLILGASGAVTALGDTLFPAGSLQEALRQDISPTAHILIRLRIFHPAIAVAVGGYLIAITQLFDTFKRDSTTRRLGRLLAGIVVVQLIAGAVNVALLAPVWMQLLHLFLADAMWIVLVLLSASVLEQPAIEGHTEPAGVPSLEATTHKP